MTDNDKRIACILLCSTLGLSESEQSTLPLSTVEWNDIAIALHRRELDPSIFLKQPIERINEQLSLSASLCERIQKLLNRAGKLAIEQSAIEGLGIQIATRNDDSYPKYFSECIGNARPPVFYVAGEPNNLFPRRITLFGSPQNTAQREELLQALMQQASFEPTTFILSETNPLTPGMLEYSDASRCNVLVTTVTPLGLILQQRSYRQPMQRKTVAYVSQTRPDNHSSKQGLTSIDWSCYASHYLIVSLQRDGNDAWKIIRFLPGTLTSMLSNELRIEELPEYTNSPTFTSTAELSRFPFEEIIEPVLVTTTQAPIVTDEKSVLSTHTKISAVADIETREEANPKTTVVKKKKTKTSKNASTGQLTLFDTSTDIKIDERRE